MGKPQSDLNMDGHFSHQRFLRKISGSVLGLWAECLTLVGIAITFYPTIPPTPQLYLRSPHLHILAEQETAFDVGVLGLYQD